jgi:hypothetical protein
MNLASRYAEAYAIARSTISLGRTIKELSLKGGLGLAALGFVLLIVLSGFHAMFAIALFLFGANCAIWGFVAGVFLSVQGQIMLAQLDTAVNTSPLATNEEKALAVR